MSGKIAFTYQTSLFEHGGKSGFSLRPYQSRAIERLLEHFDEYQRALAVLATGMGKTEIGIGLCQHFLELGKNVLWITPLDDLLNQTVERFQSRGIQVGVEQQKRKSDLPCTVASYRSLLSGRRADRYCHGQALVVVDEVHRNYSKRSLEMLGQLVQGGAKLLGLTASPDRMTGDPLTKFYGPAVLYYGISLATQHGWLVPGRCYLTLIESLDLSKAKATRFSDFEVEVIDRAMRQERVCHEIAQMVLEYWEGQPSVVFCHSIRQAEMLRDVLARHGVDPAIVHSDMDREERRMHLTEFEEGRVNIILNVSCLTLGWDCPRITKLFIARPTASKSNYIQMWGRGTRPLTGTLDNAIGASGRRAAIAASGKPHFEVFDITDSSRHNDLLCGLDMLAPEENPDLMRRAKKRAEGSAVDATKLDELLKAERAEMAREREALDSLYPELRGQILSQAELRAYELSAIRAAEEPPKARGWRMTWGKHQGQLLRELPLDYLEFVNRKYGHRSQPIYGAIRKELHRRRAG